MERRNFVKLFTVGSMGIATLSRRQKKTGALEENPELMKAPSHEDGDRSDRKILMTGRTKAIYLLI